MFELPLQPHLVLKRYRRPAARAVLDEIVAWPESIGNAELARRVAAAAAWPAVARGTRRRGRVAPCGRCRRALAAGPPALRPAPSGRDDPSGDAQLSHGRSGPSCHRLRAGATRAGRARSASGLVYALARVLEAFETGRAPVGPWRPVDQERSLVAAARPRGVRHRLRQLRALRSRRAIPHAFRDRRRAMTPNWDDPAVKAGANPTLESDRYSLALDLPARRRAANFPIQARQRQGGPITVDFAVPCNRFGEALLGPAAPLWDLCEQGLSVSRTPPPSACRGLGRLPGGGPRHPGRINPYAQRLGQPGRRAAVTGTPSGTPVRSTRRHNPAGLGLAAGRPQMDARAVATGCPVATIGGAGPAASGLDRCAGGYRARPGQTPTAPAGPGQPAGRLPP